VPPVPTRCEVLLAAALILQLAAAGVVLTTGIAEPSVPAVVHAADGADRAGVTALGSSSRSESLDVVQAARAVAALRAPVPPDPVPAPEPADAAGAAAASASGARAPLPAATGTSAAAPPATAPPPPPPPPSPAPEPAPDVQSRADYEARVVAGVNAERTSRGLPALRADACAERHADPHAERMAASGRLEHQDVGAVLAACGASAVAENVGRGTGSPEQMVQAWMDSSSHRATILDPHLTVLGTGVARAEDGRWYACQVFLAR
jgi:uncharacterized protein YkwD